MSVPVHLKKFISNLPETPGIYKFFDEKTRLLYIGKSKNLKKRVTSYFRKQSDDTHERTLRLIFHIHQIETIQTETELEALILEDNLIKKNLPPYNIKQKRYKDQVYLTVSTDDYPLVKIITSAEIDLFSKIFGPFKDKFSAENLLNILQEILLIRACSDPVPNKKCVKSSIGRCSGPCKQKISQNEYQKLIDVAISFLLGNSDSIIEIISQKITEAASELQFEEAAKWRDIRDYCLNFGIRQRFISDFRRENLIIKSSQNNQTFLFQKGKLIKIYKRKPSDKMIKNYFQIKKKNYESNSHYLMDRAYVVWVWMKRNGTEYEIC
ncbi:MAG: GIY-YIG nuclease family protein [Armatimonadetes bacterium]|nr:GIY-YIG nuclease family protein [Armatimonadota bacterium]